MKTGNPCSRCEALPSSIDGAGKLYLWFPLGHTFNKVINHFLRLAGDSCHIINDRQCVVSVNDNDEVVRFVTKLIEMLSSEEIKDTNALFINGSGEPEFSDFARITSLRQFYAMAQSGWVLDMLGNERVTSFFQPITHAADTSHIFAQEALLRGIAEDGTIIPPGRIFGLCRDADMLFQLDLLARRTAVREAGRHNIRSRIFINFNPTAIYDPTFCLRSTVRAITEANISPERIVFEVTESDRSPDGDHLKRILEYYRNAGFGVALDDLGSGYSSLNLIHQLRPDYIKLDMDLIRDVDKDVCKAVIAEKIFDITRELGIKTVAEGIETIEELEWVREHGADYVQGFFIAKPSAIPVTSIANHETARPASQVKSEQWASILHDAVETTNARLVERGDG